MSSEKSMYELQFKNKQKIMKNYNWEYFKSQINKKLSEPETKNIYSQRKIDVEPVFGFMKAILGFTRMSVRGLNKVKRELGFVLMALNIRKVVAQRAENNQKFIKRQFLYYFNRNCLFHLSKNFMSRTLLPLSIASRLFKFLAHRCCSWQCINNV